MRGCQARTTKSKDRIERYEALKNQDAPETRRYGADGCGVQPPWQKAH